MNTENRHTEREEHTMTMVIKTSAGWIKGNDDTLNLISILASEAAEKFRREGSNGLAAQAEKISSEIYETLKANGVYDF